MRAAERVARTLISIGGICTILAVSLICLFLVWVVAPLFTGAGVSEGIVFATEAPARVRHCGIDEYERLAWALDERGSLAVYRLDSGERLFERPLVEGGDAPTAVAFNADEQLFALGFASGEARLCSIRFDSSYVTDEGQPDAIRMLRTGEIARQGDGLIERTAAGQLRAQTLKVELERTLQVAAAGDGAALRLLDVTVLSSGPVVAALTGAGELSLHVFEQTENMLTGETTESVERAVLPFTPAPDGNAPQFLEMFGGGDGLVLAWRDGRAVRYDARDKAAPVVAERLDFVEDASAELTSLECSLGKRSLIAGDSRGNVSGWFRTKPDVATTVDGATLVRAHEFDRAPAAVSSIAPSAASRAFAVNFADGELRLLFMTNAKQLARLHSPRGQAASALALSPRQGALVAFYEGGFERWELDLGHPEANFASLLRPVWYESYAAPAHEWQSGGSEDFEAKLGLMPLIFGTLKATLYSMLFGVPIALLAAIFSSEFLHPRLRVALKSVIEIMASLPSVVLGFLAAVVIAPFIQDFVPVVLTAFFAVPFTLLLGARIWQLLPHKFTLLWSGWKRFLFIAAMVPLGMLLAVGVAPSLERWLFAGSLEQWLNNDSGSPLGGWVLLLVPLSAFTVVFAFDRALDPWIRRISHAWDRNRCARADLLRFVAAAVATIALALGVAALLSRTGFDPRGSIVGGYVQRNALVVGFVMGFAIIPIIYTLAEDALSSVPEHLRLASLGAGATPWQTAVRVIIPTATSGLFSAVMIGLGRAVGETMIVLMAAGGTAIMDWNIFSGFRTLSATIAVELPEAVENSTLYRTLFLAGLALFAITFVLNTGAELVRQRFRKRAFQL